MKIIRDEECFELMMIPLLVEWNIRRCNVKDCTNKPNTIVTQVAEDIPIAGLCEKHYQEAAKEGGANFILEFDDYDAFVKDDG
jgi:hypothetical protein